MNVGIMSKNKSLRDILTLCLCVIACILIQVLITSTARMESIRLGDILISMDSIRGMLQSLIGFICLIMVCSNAKGGDVIALTTLGISLFFMLGAVITKRSASPINGIIFDIVSIISVIIISRQVKRIEEFGVRDDLTGLRNKRGMEYALIERLNQRKKVYLLKIRVKNVRAICDTLGYEYGDMALKILAERFEETLNGRGVLGKLDGLEYAVILNDTNDPMSVSEELLKCATQCLTLYKNGDSVNSYLSAYIGVACYPNDANDYATLMKCSDIAMYKAVKEKSKVAKVYNEEMACEITRRNELEHIVKESLEKDYFYMVYQPQFEVSTRKLRGFESLLRLRMPNGENVSPAEFIPVAEATDLIFRIDEYVLRRAMREFKDVLVDCGESFLISINVSAKNMGSIGFTNMVKSILDETGFPPGCLEIEITEYSLGKSRKQTIQNIEELRKLGVMVALDDFGTGYTSLAQLLHLPINLLKIDKSLVDNIENDQVSRDFIDAVIYMGHLMECEVITEGVETQEQLNLLREHTCDYVQGYVWGKPLEYLDAINLAKDKDGQ